MELNENGIKRLPSVEMPWLKYFKDCDIREEVPKKTIYNNFRKCFNKKTKHL